MKKTILLALAATIGAGAALVDAGAKSSPGLYATTGGAGGALGVARNSADSTQYIGCRFTGYASSSYSIHCWARNATGGYTSCFVTSAGDPHGSMRDAVMAINSDSYIMFHVNADGSCPLIQVTNDSRYAPKEP